MTFHQAAFAMALAGLIPGLAPRHDTAPGFSGAVHDDLRHPQSRRLPQHRRQPRWGSETSTSGTAAPGALQRRAASGLDALVRWNDDGTPARSRRDPAAWATGLTRLKNRVTAGHDALVQKVEVRKNLAGSANGPQVVDASAGSLQPAVPHRRHRDHQLGRRERRAERRRREPPARWKRAYTSPGNAFPSVRPRPTSPTLALRSFRFDAVKARAVRFVALENQRTGHSGYADPKVGELDADPMNPHGLQDRLTTEACRSGRPSSRCSTADAGVAVRRRSGLSGPGLDRPDPYDDPLDRRGGQ